MNTFTKVIVGTALALSVSVGFAQAATLTADQVNAILNLIRSFGANQSIINNVQLSLTGSAPSVGSGTAGNVGGDTSNSEDNRGGTGAMGGDRGQGSQGDNSQGQGSQTCLAFNRNLGEGDQGDDVKGLQQMLSNDGEFEGTATGFFGPITARALAMWQEHNGIASSTNGGALGPLTRGFLERRCGAGAGDNGLGNGGIPGNGGAVGSTTVTVPPPAATTTASTTTQ